MIKRTLYILIFLFVFIFFTITANAQDSSVIKNVIFDDAGKLIFINGTNFNNVETIKSLKLSNPDRVVFDLPNSILIGKKRSIDITDSAINNVKVSQFSTYPNIVRLVFTADTQKSLEQVKISKSKNSLILRLNSVENKKNEIIPIYTDRDFDNKQGEGSELKSISNQSQPTESSVIDLGNIILTDKAKTFPVQVVDQNIYDLVINTIKFKNSHLTLSGTGALSLKEPFVLQNPSRVVFDLSNTALSPNDFPQAFTYNNGDILRIAQFDPQTVRVVVETNNPDNYKTIISPDLQTIIITPKDKINITELPNNKIASQIQKIEVRNVDKKTTIVTLNATSPIIHHVKRLYYPDRFKIELFNVNAPNKNIIANLPLTDQYQGLSIDSIEKYPNGSCWTFPVKRSTKVQSKLSFDGKTLELIFRKVPVKFVNNLSSIGKVVLDPGHGGTEPGALSENVFEKTITLEVAKIVKNYLNQAGINVVMTRTDDETVTLKQRTIITNDENPEVFVSIHVNSCESQNVTGIETHWYTSRSKKLAQIIQNKLVNLINSPDRGVMNSMFYVIHHTNVPAVLVEIGFLSNDIERSQLLKSDRQERTARAIADGIIKFMELKLSGNNESDL
ncbi:MAG: N-acetylmuramoyl-L-alanine amidase [Candidatus Gastranaerophilales bacterium]|nr:N-acetylmuramoyl-L-alanine amidase [Candidatus Gastranaerophilales bacterium]